METPGKDCTFGQARQCLHQNLGDTNHDSHTKLNVEKEQRNLFLKRFFANHPSHFTPNYTKMYSNFALMETGAVIDLVASKDRSAPEGHGCTYGHGCLYETSATIDTGAPMSTDAPVEKGISTDKNPS